MPRSRFIHLLPLVLLLFVGIKSEAADGSDAVKIACLQGEMVGETTTNSAILQSRLTAGEKDEAGDVPGRAGVARFEYADKVNSNVLNRFVKASNSKAEFGKLSRIPTPTKGSVLVTG